MRATFYSAAAFNQPENIGAWNMARCLDFTDLVRPAAARRRHGHDDDAFICCLPGGRSSLVPYHEPEGPAGLPIGTRLRANALYKCLFFTLCNGDTSSAGSLSDDDVPDIDNLASASGLQLQRALAFVAQEYDDELLLLHDRSFHTPGVQGSSRSIRRLRCRVLSPRAPS